MNTLLVGLFCAIRQISQHGYSLKLNPGTQGQCPHLEGDPGWTGQRGKVFGVDDVESVQLVDAGHQHGCPDNVPQVASRSPQDGAQVGYGLLS